ncbi:NfeD family protein [Bdellovibrio sp. HCB337]|uniref:NfeD family protein n=1 Tax=Bdellovibrio sp. HCB337 TaxID=3394358 RepID=UPI0039A6F691
MKLLGAFLGVLFISLGVFAQEKCTVAVTIREPIGAATLDYLTRAERFAVDNKCGSIFVRMNTPGGSLQSTRLIIEKILASPVPYLCLISPSGGHAGSAGAIILMACHVSGGLTATNIGAATPILGGNTGETPTDLRNKMVNDTVSWLEGIAKLRGRNQQFAKEIVTEAKAVSIDEAIKIKALDIVANNELEFLNKAKGSKVQIREDKDLAVDVGSLREFEPDLRYKILNFTADPEIAYLLFMGSIALLYAEITHPGLVAPGVIGGIGLILSLIAFHKLDVEWGGLALILLGVAFLIAEVFVASFGILGVGGIISFVVGSLLLFDRETTGYTLPWTLIAAVTVVVAGFMLGLGYLALRTIRTRRKDADFDLKTKKVKVVAVDSTGLSGQVEIQGEFWKFISDEKIQMTDDIQVLGRQGLTLKISKKE